MGGVMFAYASRQPLHKKVVRNSWLIVIGNCGCSLVAGFTVFALLGHFATVQGVGINDIGIGSTFVVAFQTFPAAFNLFQGAGVPQIMAVLFFITLLCSASIARWPSLRRCPWPSLTPTGGARRTLARSPE